MAVASGPYILSTSNEVTALCAIKINLNIQFPKMNVRRLLSYEAKLLFSEGRGRM